MSNVSVLEQLLEDSSGNGTVLMSPEGYVACAVALAFIGVFGFSLNLFVIVLMCKEKQVRIMCGVLSLNSSIGSSVAVGGEMSFYSIRTQSFLGGCCAFCCLGVGFRQLARWRKD